MNHTIPQITISIGSSTFSYEFLCILPLNLVASNKTWGMILMLEKLKRGIMLVELAIGDQYGASFEFKPEEFVKKYNHGKKYIPLSNSTRGKKYTDDTQMSLGLAELILSNKDWTPLNIASHFLAVFKRDPRDGYSTRLYKFLTECQTAEEFLEKIDPISERSGSAMRSVPLGIFKTEHEVIEKATIQAEITHKTKAGVAASVAVGLMSFYLRNKLGAKKDIPKFLAKFSPEWEWDKPWNEQAPNLGIPCVKAALSAIINHNTLNDVLKASINICGDTDTIAAIAMGCASQSKEMINNIPIDLKCDMESGKYGKDYLKKIDNLLNRQITPLFG